MPRQRPNAALEALLIEAGWSAADLARAVNALGAAQGLTLRYGRSSIAHWLAGSRPRSPVPELAAGAFSRRTGRLVTAQDTGLTPVPHHHGPPLLTVPPGKVNAMRYLTGLCREDIDPVRRARLTRTPYRLTAQPSWRPDTTPAPGPGAGLVPVQARYGRTATVADARALRETAQAFAALADCHGGAPVRLPLAVYLADHALRLLAAPARETVHRELLTATAQLTHLLARMTADTGHPGLAQQYYTAALHLSREAGDRRLYAITLRAMSLQALTMGHPHHAHRLTETALTTAGPAADEATRAFLLTQHALTSARTRQPRQALHTLTTAETLHDQATSPPGIFTAYPRAGLDYQRAQTLTALGHHTDAIQALRDSLAHRPADERRARALTHARLAESLLHTGHLEEACTHWHHFLTHYPHLHSHPTDQALTHLQHTLTPHHHNPHAHTLLQHAHTLTTHTSPRTPGTG
ncbi:tol-pal system YbgF family protein [Streptomyces sp. NPDC020379]|uniref:tol-pal system YbgF family protein n=1 Tax=Streptomyces sp. NPDC020379 TaxID=3365071 RepID=UPI0037B31727